MKKLKKLLKKEAPSRLPDDVIDFVAKLHDGNYAKN